MNAKLEHVVLTGQLETGAFAAYSSVSPYFFFEAETEKAALTIAARALNFYYKIQGSIEQPKTSVVDRKLTSVLRPRSHRLEIESVAA
jgi:hypothetical protein